MKCTGLLCTVLICGIVAGSAYSAVYADQSDQTTVTQVKENADPFEGYTAEQIKEARSWAESRFADLNEDEYLLVDPQEGGYFNDIGNDIRKDEEMIKQVCRNGETPEFITVKEAIERDILKYLEMYTE